MALDELDKLAAEKVMGWALVNTDPSVASMYQIWWDGNEEKYDANQWQPTRNIAQAWECLEKVGVFTLALKTYHDGSEHAYHVILPGNITVTSNLAQEAIVRACLRAKGVEV